MRLIRAPAAPRRKDNKLSPLGGPRSTALVIGFRLRPILRRRPLRGLPRDRCATGHPPPRAACRLTGPFASHSHMSRERLGSCLGKEICVVRKILASIAALLLVALIVLTAVFRPDRALRIVAAVVAHNVCAKSFVSGLDPETSFAEITSDTSLRFWRAIMTYQLDRAAGTVEIFAFGRSYGLAAFHEGFGCVIVNGSRQPYVPQSDIQALKAPQEPPLLPEIAGPDLVEPGDDALRAALTHAFEEPGAVPTRRTKAVVVVHNGHVIAERYAPGVGIDTQLLGFSLTKSVINALIGIMANQGLISPSMPAPIPEWHSPSDPRHRIEIEHLLRMTTGLALDETFVGFDQSSEMYVKDDMADFAAKAALIAPPGTRWHYSSGSTQLLARIIRDMLGGPEQALGFAWRTLFDPLGMRHVTLEFDPSGTLQGASNMLASARDWARFGLLYLNNGVIGGKRILQEGWVDFCAAATLETNYGAGFWTNRGKQRNARADVPGEIPRDAFFAAGAFDQRVAIIPSRNLVVVRLGDGQGDVQRLIREVLAATRE
ncbi:serine hydrolase domain-containing protein [Bradyrhizobium sp. UFLA05-112]